MNLPEQIAKHFREVFVGGNWTSVDLKNSLADISWTEATTPVHSLNTIAALVFHMNYFVSVAMKVLQGGPLVGSDKVSFDLVPIRSQEDWENLVNKTLREGEQFASLVELLPEKKLWETFADEKYGNYYYNIHGIIEHTYYHLGQIVLIRKLLKSGWTEAGN